MLPRHPMLQGGFISSIYSFYISPLDQEINNSNTKKKKNPAWSLGQVSHPAASIPPGAPSTSQPRGQSTSLSGAVQEMSTQSSLCCVSCN